jgi:hypothetical protein
MQEFSESQKGHAGEAQAARMTACYGMYLDRSSDSLIGVPWWEHRRSDWPPLPPLGAPPPLPDTPPCSASGTSDWAPCSPGSSQTLHCACPETGS